MKTMAYLHATNDRCVSMERHNYVNARELVLRTDAVAARLTVHELGAILAGLRLLQQVRAADEGLDDAIFAIFTDGEAIGLSDPEIDALCERLNGGGQ